MPSKVWDEIIYSFLNFNGCTVEVWEWISNFIPHIIGRVITYPRCEGAPDRVYTRPALDGLMPLSTDNEADIRIFQR